MNELPKGKCNASTKKTKEEIIVTRSVEEREEGGKKDEDEDVDEDEGMQKEKSGSGEKEGNLFSSFCLFLCMCMRKENELTLDFHMKGQLVQWMEIRASNP